MKKRVIFDLLIIFFIGLLPLLWFKEGTVIAGHDSGLSFDPIGHFLDRLYIWSQRFGIGTDQSPALLGAFFIHGFESLLSFIGLSIQQVQKVQFVFWFTLPGLAMYFFAYKIFPDKKYLPLIAAIIYMLNFYLLQGWFIAERTKFSIYAALPLVLYCLIRYLTGKMRFFPAIIFSGFVLGIFNGGGSFPLYGGLLFAILIIYIYCNVINRDSKTLQRTIFYTIGFSIIYGILSAYWLIPYVFYIFGFFSRDLANAGGPEGALSWAAYLSRDSSFFNFFRGQGIPEWQLNPYHPYAKNFLDNPGLIIASFLFPLLAFGALLIKKSKTDKFYIYLFVVIALVGILFSAGPSSQLGIIYELMVRYIPGFAMFRSAFYKFNYIVWFAYGLLIGYTLNHLFSYLENKFFKNHALLFSKFIVIIFVAGYILYHYPVLTGSFFDYSSEPGKELSTRITVPEYIFQFGKWVSTQDPSKRYLVMPQLRETSYISYQWGYWSIAPITSLLTRNSFVHNTALIPESERLLMEQMYAAFLRGDMESFRNYADVFAIDAVVLQKDYDWQNTSWGTIDPQQYEKILDSDPLFKLERTFGEWKVYDLTDRPSSLRISATNRLSYLQVDLDKIVSFPYFNPKAALFMEGVEQKKNEYYASRATELFISSPCIACGLQNEDSPFEFYNPRLLPGSFLYPYITFQEKQLKKKANDFSSFLNYYITTANRRIVEIKWMADSGQNREYLLFAIEQHYQSLLNLETLLSSEEWDKKGEVEQKAANFVITHLLKQVQLIDSTYKSSSFTLDHRLLLARNHEKIEEIEKLAKRKAWRTESIVDKKYLFDVPQTTAYEIYVKKDTLTNPEQDVQSVAVSIDDSVSRVKPTAEKEGWLSFGTVQSNNKKLRLTLHDHTVRNLLENQSPIYLSDKNGIISQGNNISFTPDSLNNCLYYELKNLETNDNPLYLISFSYRNFSDKHNLIFFVQDSDTKFLGYERQEKYLPNSKTFVDHRQLIIPAKPDQKLYFCNGYLSLDERNPFRKSQYSSGISVGQPVIEIRNVVAYKVASPTIVLYKRYKEENDKNMITHFTKPDPVTYQITTNETEEPVSLLMKESFGRYWQLCDEGNNCRSFDDSAHFANAGFANAWYFENGIGKNVTLFYHPQKMFLIGTIITITAMMFIAGGICLHVLRKK